MNVGGVVPLRCINVVCSVFELQPGGVLGWDRHGNMWREVGLKSGLH